MSRDHYILTGHLRLRAILEEAAVHPCSSDKRKKLAKSLLEQDTITEKEYLNFLQTTGDKKYKGQGIREEYESRKYKKGTRWYTGSNKKMRAIGLEYTPVEVIGTYKTYSNWGFKNWTIHVRVLEGEKAGKEYRLSNVALYKKEELT